MACLLALIIAFDTLRGKCIPAGRRQAAALVEQAGERTAPPVGTPGHRRASPAPLSRKATFSTCAFRHAAMRPFSAGPTAGSALWSICRFLQFAGVIRRTWLSLPSHASESPKAGLLRRPRIPIPLHDNSL